MSAAYAFLTTVASVAPRVQRMWVSGTGSEAVWRDEPLGWFVTFQDSHEALWLGDERPDLEPGDRVKISIQKAG